MRVVELGAYQARKFGTAVAGIVMGSVRQPGDGHTMRPRPGPGNCSHTHIHSPHRRTKPVLHTASGHDPWSH